MFRAARSLATLASVLTVPKQTRLRQLRRDVTMLSDLERMKANFAEIHGDCTAMKQRLTITESNLCAMRAAQLHGSCPQGFDKERFAMLVKQFNQDAQLFERSILAVESHYKNQLVKFQRKESQFVSRQARINKRESNINKAKKQTVCHPMNRQGIPSVVRNPMDQQRTPFANTQEAFDAFCTHIATDDSEPNELSDVKWYNAAAITEGVTTGVEVLMDGFGVAIDKSESPLMCVLGARGQGKTNTLKHIQGKTDPTTGRRIQGELQTEIMSTINGHANWAATRGSVKCKHVVSLFATFSHGGAYVPEVESNVELALCNRVLSGYLCRELDVKNSSRFDRIILDDVIEFIREREAQLLSCNRNEICIVVLVDDVREVHEGAFTIRYIGTVTFMIR